MTDRRRAQLADVVLAHPEGDDEVIRRHFEPDSTIAASLLVAVPPVGGALIVAERALDGAYWLRRKFD